MKSLLELLGELGGESDSDEEPFLKGLKLIVDENPLDLGHDVTDFYKEAINYLKKKIREDPDNSSLQYYLGQCQLRTGQYKGALIRFNKLVENEPDNVLGYLGKGFYYLEKDDPEKAIIEFNRAKDIDPDNWHCYIGIGACYFEQDRYKEAEKAFERAGKLYPINTVTSDLYLHDCYMKQGKHDKAIEMCEEIANSHVNNLVNLSLSSIKIRTMLQDHTAKVSLEEELRRLGEKVSGCDISELQKKAYLCDAMVKYMNDDVTEISDADKEKFGKDSRYLKLIAGLNRCRKIEEFARKRIAELDKKPYTELEAARKAGVGSDVYNALIESTKYEREETRVTEWVREQIDYMNKLVAFEEEISTETQKLKKPLYSELFRKLSDQLNRMSTRIGIIEGSLYERERYRNITGREVEEESLKELEAMATKLREDFDTIADKIIPLSGS